MKFFIIELLLINSCNFQQAFSTNKSNFTVKYFIMDESKKASETVAVMTEIVLPNDTNIYNNLRGGRILHWMDMAAAISAQKHSGAQVVTASVDSVSFKNPIRIGTVVTIHSKVTRAFHTSMEVYLEVWAENIPERKKYKSNEAYYTFVAIDDFGRPTPVPKLIPESEEEKRQFDGAKRRRELRLILSGKMKAEDSVDLKALFVKDINDLIKK